MNMTGVISDKCGGLGDVVQPGVNDKLMSLGYWQGRILTAQMKVIVLMLKTPKGPKSPRFSKVINCKFVWEYAPPMHHLYNARRMEKTETTHYSDLLIYYLKTVTPLSL